MVDDVLRWLAVGSVLACSACGSNPRVSGCLEVVSLSSDSQTTQGEASLSLDVRSLEGRVWLHELYLGSSNGGGEHAVRSIDANPFPMKANGSRLSATFGFTVTPPFEPSEPRLRAVLYAEDWDVSNAWGEDGFIHLDFYFNDYNCPSHL
jgi:hypothetical protein